MIKKVEVPLMLIARTVILVRDLNERLHQRAPVRQPQRLTLKARAQ